MGKAARWLRNFLGGKKDKEPGKEQRRPATPNAAPAPTGDRKRWSFCKSSRDSSTSEADPPSAPGGNNAAIARAAEAAWLKSLYKDTEREQSKHAIAVAAATAAAADAAVAAAHAAVEVVRLTSQGPTSVTYSGAFAGRAAGAVKIQTAFRGFLAKKALRALKALVKLQALVRGYLVRKQAAATLQSMQALVRAQASIRAARSSRAAALPHLRLNNPSPVVQPRYSLQERYATTDDTRSEHGSVAAYYSRRLSASVESSSCGGYDRSPKIVEMDTGRPKSRSSSLRTSPPVASEAGTGEDCYAYSSYSVSSPLPPCHHHHHLLPAAPPRIAARHFPDYEWCEKVRPATAQSTPRYTTYAPVTPTKSACGGGGGYSNSPSSLNCPSYMSSTRSSVAKVRSQSAPKQRPEEVSGSVRKRVPLSEVIILQEARASLSGGVGTTQRSCNREEAFNFKKAVVSRFDARSSEDRDRDLFLQHKGW